jgi:hypothetical protein
MRITLLGVGLLVVSFVLAPPSAHAHEVEASYTGALLLRVGVELSEHAHFTVGAYGGLYRDGYERIGGSFGEVRSDFSAGGELGLKFYLRDPLEGAFVPHVRLLGSYGATRRRHNADVEWGRAFSTQVGLGLTYFPRAVIGLGAEATLGYGEHRYTTSRHGSGRLGMSLLVTFRPGAHSAARVVSNVPPPPPASYDDFSTGSAGSAADFPARSMATPSAAEATTTPATIQPTPPPPSAVTPAPTTTEPSTTEPSTTEPAARATDTTPSAANAPAASTAEAPVHAASAEALASPVP